MTDTDKIDALIKRVDELTKQVREMDESLRGNGEMGFKTRLFLLEKSHYASWAALGFLAAYVFKDILL